MNQTIIASYYEEGEKNLDNQFRLMQNILNFRIVFKEGLIFPPKVFPCQFLGVLFTFIYASYRRKTLSSNLPKRCFLLASVAK